MRKVWIIAMATMASCPNHVFAQSTQFDLLCEGNYVRSGEGATKSPYANEFVIDENARNWCEGVCHEINRIDSIDDDEIRLVFHMDHGDVIELLSIDRRSLKLVYNTHSVFGEAAYSSSINAACKILPFKGFQDGSPKKQI